MPSANKAIFDGVEFYTLWDIYIHTYVYAQETVVLTSVYNLELYAHENYSPCFCNWSHGQNGYLQQYLSTPHSLSPLFSTSISTGHGSSPGG